MEPNKTVQDIVKEFVEHPGCLRDVNTNDLEALEMLVKVELMERELRGVNSNE